MAQARGIPAEKQTAFTAAARMHLASHGSDIVGGLVLIAVMIAGRLQPVAGTGGAAPV